MASSSLPALPKIDKCKARVEKYYLDPMRCKNCNKPIEYKVYIKRKDQAFPKFCTRRCSIEHAWIGADERRKTSALLFKYKKPVSEQTRKMHSVRMSLRPTGGRCKWFTVSGQKVQGTWEKLVAEKFDDLEVRWTKLGVNGHEFPYVMDGKTRSYTPDFFLPDFDVYLEIKGYWWGRDKEKTRCVFEQHPDKKIIVVEKDSYKKILNGEFVWL